jgi:acyclic terpene utilization AtuA family protein
MSRKECVALYGGRLMHGGGTVESVLALGLDRHPDYVASDGGSTDPGPYYLGSGKVMTHRSGLESTVRALLRGARSKRVPLLMGSVGIAGARPQVEYFEDLVREVAREEGLHFRLAVIQSEMEKRYLEKQLEAGRIRSFDGSPPLTAGDVDRASHIVAMMGPEPMIAALEGGADVVIAGRCSDSALFASYPLMKGFPPGLCWHMAKTIECNVLIAEVPKGQRSDIFARISEDDFVVAPTNELARCPRVKVAAHTLYENPSPVELHEPGGMIDTRRAAYEQLDERSVRVTGSAWVPAPVYTVKLEGAELVGYRTIFIAGIRDPILIGQLDAFLERVRDAVTADARTQGLPPDFQLRFSAYGRDAVMGELEPTKALPHEVGLLGECIAPTQETADAIMNIAHGVALHGDYPGRMAIAGNMAYPFSPCDIPAGPVYRFSVWHLMEIDDPLALFPITYAEL